MRTKTQRARSSSSAASSSMSSPPSTNAYRLRPPFSDNLNDLMNAESFRQSVPEVVQNKLHTVRKAGNHAAHPRRPITEPALARMPRAALRHCALVPRAGRWRRPGSVAPKFVPPPPEPEGAAKTKEALEKLRLAEAKYESVLAALEEETKKRLDAERSATEHATELAQLKDEGQKVATFLQFNEETTRRRLIDQALLAAGWNVGANGANTEQVEAGGSPLERLPTASGEGLRRLRALWRRRQAARRGRSEEDRQDARAGRASRRASTPTPAREGNRRASGHLLHQRRRHLPLGRCPGLPVPEGLRLLLEGQPGVPAHQRAEQESRSPRSSPTSPSPTACTSSRRSSGSASASRRNFRKALLVQATGTGKTRVAISLCDVLMRAGWAKRILFLCDRRELRKQADRVFKEFLPGEPRVDRRPQHRRGPRQAHLPRHLPGDDEVLRDFDVGFFDLIIADESHRSIYNSYRDLFQYFDALEVGLTATPVDFIERNTYELFGCEDRDPTSHFSFEDAINSHAAVPRARSEVVTHTHPVPRDGIKYSRDDRRAARPAREDEEVHRQPVDYDARGPR